MHLEKVAGIGILDRCAEALIDLGFFSALGTSEYPGFTSEECHVKRGTPNSQDYNNGVLVVYDEDGRPWIMHGSKVDDTVRQGLSGYDLCP